MVSTRQMATSCNNSNNATASNSGIITNAVGHSHQQQQQAQTQQQQQQQPQQQQQSNNSETTSVDRTTENVERISVVKRQTMTPSSSLIGSHFSPTIPLTIEATALRPIDYNCSITPSGASTSRYSLKPANKAETKTPTWVPINEIEQKNLLDLPAEILENIFTYLGYKKIAHLRLLSHKANDICMNILNSTFCRMISQTFNRFHAIKYSMPRRESARRLHPLSCECDIIETCYMRLSLLQMTFGKHIERGHCCFFPGAILDEVNNILYYIRTTERLERPYRVTDELFDLSTMAMEYFRDCIEPKLPDIAYFNKDFFNSKIVIADSDKTEDDSSNDLPSPPQSNMVLRKGIRKIKQGMKMYNNQLSLLRSELRTCKRKATEQGKHIAEQQKLFAEQQKQTLEYANRLDENDKKNEEISRKFSSLLQELNKCKTELQYWRSKSPAIPLSCTSCGQKMTPTLPLEDYQALINQGVKPENILNLNDDTDGESDVSISDSNLSLSNDEFVFPDQTTTAKLLAINTATKNTKRQHCNINSNGNGNDNLRASTIVTNTFASNNITSNGDSNGNCGISINCVTNNTRNSVLSCNLNVNEANCSSNLIRVIPTASKFSQNPFDLENGKSNGYNLGYGGSTNSTANAATQMTNATTSYSTKLFYANSNGNDNGNHQQSYKSVIVSPTNVNITTAPTTTTTATTIGESNASATSGQKRTATIFEQENKCNELFQTVDIIDNDGIVSTLKGIAAGSDVDGDGDGGGVLGHNNNNNNSIGSSCVGVENLQALNAANETKKARRVQKATRCLNGSGKRSKY